MISAPTLTAIRTAIRLNEVGNASPYQLSLAGKGKSGGSFGVYQGDAHTDQPLVTDCLRQVLAANKMQAGDIDRIVSAISAICVENPLSDAETLAVNAALVSQQGQTLVDAMDAQLEIAIVSDVELCVSTAAQRGVGLDTPACTYVAAGPT